MNILIKEIKNFSRQNWWVYIIFLICLLIIWYTEKWSILEVTLVFFAHFLWDLLAMMMWDYYSKKEFKYWAISHISSNIVFMFILLYAVFYSLEWQYFLPNIAFILWWIKTYFLQVKSKDIKILNLYTLLFVNLVIFVIYVYFDLFWEFYSYIQFLGFVLWSTCMIIQKNK